MIRKVLRIIVALTSMVILQFDLAAQSRVIELPLKFRYNDPPFAEKHVESFTVYPNWQASGNAPLGRMLPKLTGIPTSWKNVLTNFFWFDIQQYVHQTYKQGKVAKQDYDSLIKTLHFKYRKAPLSDRPINCFAAYVSGIDEKGNLRYKIDLNHNLNFKDDPIQSPVGNTAYLMKLHPNDGQDTVEYQTLRNGKVVKRSAFLDVYPFDGKIQV